LPDAGLLEYSGEHLKYEIDMLREAAALLPGIAPDTTWENAVLESWVVHLRNLIDFLYPRRRRADDVVADDFVDDPDEWERRRRPLSEPIREARERADKRLAHLTTQRKGPEDLEGKEWAFAALTAELLVVLRQFGKSASKARLHPDVLTALA
jgi:hypothetical protein